MMTTLCITSDCTTGYEGEGRTMLRNSSKAVSPVAVLTLAAFGLRPLYFKASLRIRETGKMYTTGERTSPDCEGPSCRQAHSLPGDVSSRVASGS